MFRIVLVLLLLYLVWLLLFLLYERKKRKKGAPKKSLVKRSVKPKSSERVALR